VGCPRGLLLELRSVVPEAFLICVAAFWGYVQSNNNSTTIGIAQLQHCLCLQGRVHNVSTEGLF
jgi:hypothetical protein